MQAASLLAQALSALAREDPAGPPGSVTWPTAAGDERARLAEPATRVLADGVSDLYSGNPGIALFLAAYSRLTGDVPSRRLCLQAFAALPAPAGGQPAADVWDLQGSPAIGALVGIGSVIYGLLSAGRILDDRALIAQAHTLSAWLTPERILADPFHDLAFGSAGALLVLLALDRLAPGPNSAGHTPLDLARLCGRQLVDALPRLAAATVPDTAGQAPADQAPADQAPATPGAGSGAAGAGNAVAKRHRYGLSHGLAGIGLALRRLYARTRDEELGRATDDTICGLLPFAPGEDGPPGCPPCLGEPDEASWCNGAPGLAIALGEPLPEGLAGGAAESPVPAACARALAWTAAAPYNPADHVCCGNMGRVAVLSQAARAATGADAADLAGAARRLGHLVLRVAKTRGGFRLDYPEGLDPSFFRGASGIGYVLLALLEPQTLPCVWAFE